MAPLELQGNDDYEAIARAVQPVPRHRSHDPANNQKRTDPFQFGSRYLEEGDDVFEFNAWDHVETDADYREYAELQYLRQKESPVSEEARDKYNANPSKFWNLFYKHNTSNFFKNRKWLHQEFPILTEVSKADAGPQVILEVGAGAGNSAFPILANNKNEQLRLHACDYSKKAVEVIRKAEHYDERYMQADVWDVSAEGEDSLPPGLGPDSVDVVVMIFIFSALSPSEWCRALRNIHRVLKPGGHVLFRDYGKGDLAQVRFKGGRWMGENFYVRGDGTRVYFFEKDELAHIWGRWSPETGIPESSESRAADSANSAPDVPDDSGFEILALGVDQRLIVNRQRKLKMYRCWMQGRFQKKKAKLQSSTSSPDTEKVELS
ncbi:actin filament binding protein [Histoplasma capsulatum G186AR]|uniref:tRNA N(3)-methylcytidine methyltransferase n=2 Tax=Ajellomyces capsulatus TaxID=5037 RepID=C0NXK4_AJECG|nr:actin filament binding protein [Histoplasma capsulatum G186AR]EEH04070.1 actin filament binding protein [Histoplasma capsulatum G186AR]KAG5295671.1 actin filament binding protein [Histoplasma capsulatum]QSS73652.1 actin filament binding protein [Histoplasma capsulatum G186AR]